MTPYASGSCHKSSTRKEKTTPPGSSVDAGLFDLLDELDGGAA